MKKNSYLIYLLFCSLFFSTGLIGLNFLINPYNIYDTPTIKGFNNIKRGVGNNIRLTKAYAFLSDDYQGVIIGASDAEVGLNPNHPGWGDLKAYNLALPGANVHEAKSYLEHALNSEDVKRAVWMINLPMFNPYKDNAPTFDRSRLSVNDKGVTQNVTDKLNTLFSLDALIKSLRTVKSSVKGKTSSTLLNGGQRNWESGREGIIKHGGFRGSFDDNFLYQFKQLLCIAPCPDLTVFVHRETGYSTIKEFEKALRYASQKNIQLDIVMSPRHATMAAALKLGFKWEYLLHWKKEIFHAVDRINRENSKQLISLWDFDDFSSRLKEEIVANGEESEMKWFWESTHFRPELGMLILSRVFNPNKEELLDFGVLLNEVDIDRYLIELTSKRESFELNYPKEVSHLKQLQKKARGL